MTLWDNETFSNNQALFAHHNTKMCRDKYILLRNKS